MKLTYSKAYEVQLGLINQALEILMAKRKDYSGTEDPLRNLRGAEFLGVPAPIGVHIRILDKLARASELIKAGSSTGDVGESLLDTYADILNYASIAFCLLCETNPELLTAALEARKHLITTINRNEILSRSMEKGASPQDDQS